MIRKQHGFTLMEMLIVVALIGVLTAIAIPLTNSQLEKVREAADAANIRAHYAQILTTAFEAGGTALNTDGSFGKVTLKQAKDGWQNTSFEKTLATLADKVEGTPAAGGEAWVTYDPAATDVIVLHYDAGSGGGGAGGGGGGESGGSSDDMLAAGTSYASSSPFMLNGRKFKITSPFTITITFTVEVHAGGSSHSAVKEEKTVTLPAGSETIVEFSKEYHNSEVTISFDSPMSVSDAEALYNSMTSIS